MKWFLGFFFLIMGHAWAQQKSIQQTFAPDRRTAWFDVKFQHGQAKGVTTIPEAKVAFLDSLAQAGISYIDSIRVLPDGVVGEKNQGIVLISVANLRALPQESSELSSQLLMGMRVNILDQVGNWLLIQSPDQYIGWTDPLGIIRMTPQEAEEYEAQNRGIFTAAHGFIYEKPEKMSQPVSDLSWGNTLVLSGKKKGPFHQVKLVDGRIGWAQHIEPLHPWTQSREATSSHRPYVLKPWP